MAEEAVQDVKKDDSGDIKNLKAEFDRKLSNIEKTNQALLAQLQSVIKPKVEEKSTEMGSLKDIWYDDPDGAARKVKDEAKKEAKKEIWDELSQQRAVEAKKGNVIQKLYQEYPELQDMDHPLTSKAIEIFNKMSPDEQNHPMAYRLAVKDAADELEIKSKARRKDTDDGFSLGNNSGRAPKVSKKKAELDQRTIDFAKLVGVNVDDEKVKERVVGYSQRTSWNRWE